MFQSASKFFSSSRDRSLSRSESIAKAPPKFETPVQAMFGSYENFKMLSDKDDKNSDISREIFMLIQSFLEMKDQFSDVNRISSFGAEKMMSEIMKEQMICLHRLKEAVKEWSRRNPIPQKQLNTHPNVKVYAKLMDDIFEAQRDIIHRMNFYLFPLPMPSDFGVELYPKTMDDRQARQSAYESSHLAPILKRLTGEFKTQFKIVFRGLSCERLQAEKDFNTLCLLLTHTVTGCNLLLQLHDFLVKSPHELIVISRPDLATHGTIFIPAPTGELTLNMLAVQPSEQWAAISQLREGLFGSQYGLGINPPEISFAESLAYFEAAYKAEKLKKASQRVAVNIRSEMGLPRKVAEENFILGKKEMRQTTPADQSSEKKTRKLHFHQHRSHSLQFPTDALTRKGVQGFWQMFFEQPNYDFGKVERLGVAGLGKNSKVFFIESSDYGGNPVEYALKFFSAQGNRPEQLEKEAIANNFIRMVGKRVAAPECRPVDTDDKGLNRFVAQVSKRGYPAFIKTRLASAWQENQFNDSQVAGLLMRRVFGSSMMMNTCLDGGSDRSGEKRRRYELNEQLFTDNPEIYLAIGELSAYNLVMGNADSAITGVNSGNMLYDVQRKMLNVFDQTISLFDMAVMGMIFTSGLDWSTGDELREMIADPDKHSERFRKTTANIRAFVPSFLTNELNFFLKDQWDKSVFLARMAHVTRENFPAFNVHPMLVCTGFVEGCLRLFEHSDLRQIMKQIRCLSFPHEFEAFLVSWQKVEETIDNVGYEKLRKKVAENQSKTLEAGFDFAHRSQLKMSSLRKPLHVTSL
ncbi:hypothetical protein [Aureibacter tunicatorum]|uniref:Uncharacterized protein n=1 Tax=Aureibacter tunicatorum TaxID=866807 RepID=A0AAE3XQ50_9BACT|nr:hypothetical protein [Aureibacter tunicatorum]MDR6240663.1 hypothetical protein [Aureibacter tunicatorum]BDD07004.1 hypothetical protein AUTU_44870 [Aureibacter tunicatorum]